MVMFDIKLKDDSLSPDYLNNRDTQTARFEPDIGNLVTFDGGR